MGKSIPCDRIAADSATPPTEALFILVIVGVLLLSVAPETALVLSAFDAIGLEIGDDPGGV